MSAKAQRTAVVAALVAVAQLLLACPRGGGNGPPTLNLYISPDKGEIQQAVKTCTSASGGRYVIRYQKLPEDADGQREQMVRRLAARDASMDILGLDVTWAPEFAEAGWIREWTGPNRAKVEEGTLEPPLRTATYKGKLYAAPFNSNTQLLWYRRDLVPTPPKTWDEMIDMASALAKQKKPHLIEVQGAPYEGVTVWFNTLLESAGGRILTDDAGEPSLGQPAVTALKIMQRLATSPAADQSLSVQMEGQNAEAMEKGKAAFQLNYPFVYKQMRERKPDLLPKLGWAPYPAIRPGESARVTIGGFNLAVSSFTKHPDEAFEATLCLRNRENQKLRAVIGGHPPTMADLYDDPALDQDYPFRKLIQKQLEEAAVRPLTPAYQSVSIVIAHTVSPPNEIPLDPESSAKDMARGVKDALESKGLVP